jgi:K+-sensing histidine kinase KdpD
MFIMNLVEDILDFSKMQLSKMELKQEWFNISDIIAEVFDLVNY